MWGRVERRVEAAEGARVFAAIVAEHGPRVWRTLRRLGVREADVEDLCQEVFEVVHRKLPEVRGEASIAPWIYGICLRVASTYRRSAPVRREDLGEAIPEVPVEAPQEDLAMRRQALAALDRVLAALDEEKRAVFVLFELEELSMHEVARAVGCPLQTAYYRLYAARRAVEAAVAQGRGGER